MTRSYLKGEYQKKQLAKFLDHFGQKTKTKDKIPDQKEEDDAKKRRDI